MATEHSGKTNGAGKSNGAGPVQAEAAPVEKEPAKPRFELITQYIRDLSFENHAAQKYITGKINQQLSVDLNIDAKTRAENRYEVVLKLSISAKNAEGSVFLLEVDYGGQFLIENYPEDKLHPLLMVECPRLLFPFLRQLARNLTAEGGFPPLNIENIDFLRLYKQRTAKSD